MCNHLNRHIGASVMVSHSIPYEIERSLSCHKYIDAWSFGNSLLGTQERDQINHSKQAIGVRAVEVL